MKGFVLATALLATAAAGKGVAYVSPDLKIPAPGRDWELQSAVPNAPQLRGAWVLAHGKDSHSIITFALDRDPNEKDAVAYLDKAFQRLEAEPISFKVSSRGPETLKGMPGARAVYTDADGRRHFTEVVAKTPAGSMFVMVLQSPDGDAFKTDVPDFDRAAKGVTIKEAPKTIPNAGANPAKGKK